MEPELTAATLEQIRRLPEEEGELNPGILDGEKALDRRAEHCKPIVDGFLEWLKPTLDPRLLLPRNLFTEAAGYALDREKQLRVFLNAVA